MKLEELGNFKKILLQKRQAILDNNLEHLQSMEHIRDLSFDEADQAAMHMKNTLDSSIFTRHNTELEYIDSALTKIEQGSYGICEMCDEPIAKERLKAKPHAKYCIVCREIIEKSSKD
ncbi:RNA polymerase-binding protein DksA [Helicobacter winghamensis]|uniref:Molecular chaperone DnaK n=1 Tax=Helicobacter winghamensis TaxID=157268 RepID=A0A2N3PJJ6_9HELI|nr:RNA polymerase-binding protein DksA [Helicobacter winghamensis]EEO26200.1 putative RNA polymerase-binding protein DksA [Helicobacter winghamensis ATCC BAA-430]PKT77198.1 molecular chaperone DnaK [Helicobacter winghamensis]PKT77396.1 molecular chaperone DnaK [Helicobacter winghamensis]PKT77870.1 molecular chaperone DnaK [Helicobacter winghamensis]PKT81363.1 molecular chaperone DnaK [Helicobacter winghamensis]